MGFVVVEDVSKVFSGDQEAIHALAPTSFEIEEAEFVSFIGPSGCGKTTLLHIIDGLIEATTGRVLVDGTRVTGPGPDRGMVFQEFALLPWRTVRGNVELGLELRGERPQLRRERADRWLSLVSLQPFSDRFPRELSGGMRQRVSIARALALDPKILLMDEPFANLDAQTKVLLEQELMNLWASTRKTILFVTHDLAEAIALSDRVVIFTARPGRVKDIVEVKLPRPRDVVEIRSHPTFAHLHDMIWRQLRDEVRRAQEESA